VAAINPYEPPRNPEKSSPGLPIGKVLFSFKGRIPRSTYWIFSIPVNLAIAALLRLLLSLGDAGPAPAARSALPRVEEAVTDNRPLIAAAIIIAYLPLLWIKLAVLAKRWHDQNRSANWLLFTFIPVVGAVVNFIECGCSRGTRGSNRYGPDPLPDPNIRPARPPLSKPPVIKRRPPAPPDT